jgi:hypothetical protein
LISFGLAQSCLYFYRSYRSTPTSLRWLKNSLVCFYLLISLFTISAFSYYYFRLYPLLSADDWRAGWTETATAVINYQDQVSQINLLGNLDLFYLWYYLDDRISPEFIWAQPTQNFQPSSLDQGKVLLHASPADLNHPTGSQLVIGPSDTISQLATPPTTQAIFNYQTPFQKTHLQGYLIQSP